MAHTGVVQTGLFADNSFYRTVPMSPAEEIKTEASAGSQDDKILNHLQETGKEMTAWELKDIFPTWEITSIRRSLFNLENKSCQIVQTGFVKERKGMKVGTYKAKL